MRSTSAIRVFEFGEFRRVDGHFSAGFAAAGRLTSVSGAKVSTYATAPTYIASTD